MKVEVMGIELVKGKSDDGSQDGYVFYLAEWIESGEGCKPLGRVYTRDDYKGVNVGDEVIPEFAQGRNGWYIKSLKKKGG